MLVGRWDLLICLLKFTVKALNDRGKILLPAIELAMKELKQQMVLALVKPIRTTTTTTTSVSMVQI
jgi:hypothetical protein